jgi:transcriptional regulator with XRE-family HTH domain
LNQLSAKLKKTREDRKLNRSQIAMLLGISSQLYGQYEDGKRIPKMPFFVKWKEKFKEDLTETIVSNETKPPVSESKVSLERSIENLTQDRLRNTAIMDKLADDKLKSTAIIESLVAIIKERGLIDPNLPMPGESTTETLKGKK